MEAARLSHLRLSVAQESGFYYLQSRYYDPSIGRFISSDEIIDTDLSNGLNLFSYCNNNPVNNYDNTGYFAIEIGAALFCLALLVWTALASTTTIYASDQIAQAVSAPIAKPTTNTQTQTNRESSSNYTVYKLVDESQTVQYVGRTKNVDTRESAHKNSPFRGNLEFQIIKSGLTYEAARSMEQAYMLYYHTINRENLMNNQINGISPHNSKIVIYVNSAAAYLENQLTNDLMNWAGM